MLSANCTDCMVCFLTDSNCYSTNKGIMNTQRSHQALTTLTAWSDATGCLDAHFVHTSSVAPQLRSPSYLRKVCLQNTRRERKACRRFTTLRHSQRPCVHHRRLVTTETGSRNNSHFSLLYPTHRGWLLPPYQSGLGWGPLLSISFVYCAFDLQVSLPLSLPPLLPWDVLT